MAADSTSSTMFDAIDEVRRAWYLGRTIVPIVGAGLSADSGFPTIMSVVRYFGKLNQYLEYRAYLWSQSGHKGDDPLVALKDYYCQSPWKFIEHFGWPDRFQLNDDLQAALLKLPPAPDGQIGPPKTVTEAVARGLTDSLTHINPRGVYFFNEFLKDIAKQRVPPDPEPTADELFRKRIDIWNGNSKAFDLLGDWKRLIQYYTGFRSGSADALFARLATGRNPSLGHRYLAFLAKLLGLGVVLTFNFDNFIERSLAYEGIHAHVFGMEQGSSLPDEILLRDSVSVVKLHGAPHALLLDERLDHPLSAHYKERLSRILGPEPLLLVVGCSGHDYRLRDLVEDMLNRAQGAQSPRVVWLHFESEPPPFLARFTSGKTYQYAEHPLAIAVPTKSPGASLMHLYSALTCRHPASGVPYTPHLERPFLMGKGTPVPCEPDAEKRFHLFSSLRDRHDAQGGFSNATQKALRQTTAMADKGYHLIWVDLESVHTLAGVVGRIIDQCRGLDPSLAPSTLSLKASPETIERDVEDAADLVTHALSRARYLVVLDGLDTFSWPPFTHHGDTRISRRDHPQLLLALVELLRKLEAAPVHESFIFATINQPISRTNLDIKHNKRVFDSLKKYERLLVDARYEPHPVLESSPPPKPLSIDVLGSNESEVPREQRPPLPKSIATSFQLKLFGTWPSREPDAEPCKVAMTLLILSCYRRTRHLVALQHLLRPIMGFGERFKSTLAEFAKHPSLAMHRLEGGYLWFSRGVRDRVYAENSKFALRDTMRTLLERDVIDESDERKELLRAATSQLFLLATTHQRIAREYYTHTFVQSQDCFAFLEYTYHRIASIRYLCKLIALASSQSLEPIRSEMTVALRLCFSFLRSATWTHEGDLRDFHELLRRMEIDIEDRKDKPTQDPLAKIALNQGSENLDAALVNRLKERHAREIRSLYRAWARAETLLRKEVPPQQLLHWCECLLDDELPYRFNRVILGYESDDENAEGFYTTVLWKKGEAGEQVNALAVSAVEAFRDFLLDLKVKVLIERSDFEAARSERERQLVSKYPGIDWLSDGKWKVAPRHVHWVLDMIACKTRLGLDGRPASGVDGLNALFQCAEQILDENGPLRAFSGEVAQFASSQAVAPAEPAPAEAASAGDASKANENAAAIAVPLETSSAGAAVLIRTDPFTPPSKEMMRAAKMTNSELAVSIGDLHEAELRYYNLLADNKLGTICAMAAGFTGDEGSRLDDDGTRLQAIKEADANVEQGLLRARRQDPRMGGSPRSVLLDPTPDGSLYPAYRSVFHMLRGRICWERGVREFSGGARDRELVLQDAFMNAYRHFEFARGGLGDSNYLLQALVEIYMVEACLARARVSLCAESSSDLKKLRAVMGEAKAKYESARLGLSRARDCLLSTRRNVIWWRFFFLMVAQYHVDRLLLTFAELTQEVNSAAPARQARNVLDLSAVGQHLTRFRRACNALRHAYDYQVRGVAPNHPDRWFWRIYSELVLSGFSVGYCVLADHLKSDPTRYPSSDKNGLFVLEHLKWLLNRERIDKADPKATRGGPVEVQGAQAIMKALSDAVNDPSWYDSKEKQCKRALVNGEEMDANSKIQAAVVDYLEKLHDSVWGRPTVTPLALRRQAMEAAARLAGRLG